MNNPPKPFNNVQKGSLPFANKSFVSKGVPRNVSKVPTKNNGQNSGAAHKPVMPRRCFGCDATTHILATCPNRRSTFPVGNKSPAPSKQVNRCVVENSRDSFAPQCRDAGRVSAYINTRLADSATAVRADSLG